MLRTVEERGVKFIRLWFVDVLGLLKSISIPVSELESALEEGVGMDGSSMEGASRLREHDVIAYPDPRTFQLLPWRPDSIVARMFCDVRQPDDGPFGGDARAMLRRVLEHAAALGYTMQVGCEVEFFIFGPLGSNGAAPVTLDDGAYFDLTPLDVGSGLPPPHDRLHRADGDPRQGLAPRGRAVAARDPARPHRRAVDGRRRHDVSPRRQGGGARARRLRDVHAQAARRASRQRHAPAHLALSGRPQRLSRRRRPTRRCRRPGARSSPACSRTPAR